MTVYPTIQGFLLWFILYFCVRFPLILLGWLIVPIIYPFRDDNNFPKWIDWLYGNREDGVMGPDWFLKKFNYTHGFKSCWHWSAWRNPANNMRFIRPFTIIHGTPTKKIMLGDADTPHPKLSRQLGRAVWHLTLVKVGFLWRMSFWYIKAKPNNKHFRIRIGYKCTPDWLSGKTKLNKTNKYAGITFQLMPSRNG